MERPGLVATDVDGTLLDPAERISARTRAAVHRVLAAGVPFVLVTGRPPRWMPPVIEQLGFAAVTICANGAVLYDAACDRVRRAVTLHPGQLRHAAEAISRALPRARLAVELATGLGGPAALNGARPTAHPPAHPASHPTAHPGAHLPGYHPRGYLPSAHFLAEPGYIHPWPGEDSRIVPREAVLRRPAIKLLVSQAETSSDRMVSAIRPVLGAQLNLTFSTGDGLVELSAPGVTKGSGLAHFAAELGVPRHKVVAFGDMPNDLSMLRWAGWGVAMANAHPTVLGAADEITALNSEEGLARVLERWF